MKKILSILLSAILILSLFSGCSNKKNTENTVSNNQTTAVSTSGTNNQSSSSLVSFVGNVNNSNLLSVQYSRKSKIELSKLDMYLNNYCEEANTKLLKIIDRIVLTD
jgi:PBP1b-binding outer membrane lipoprotein LpoB